MHKQFGDPESQFDRSKPNGGVGPAPAGDGTKVLSSPNQVTEGGLFNPEPPFAVEPKTELQSALESIEQSELIVCDANTTAHEVGTCPDCAPRTVAMPAALGAPYAIDEDLTRTAQEALVKAAPLVEQFSHSREFEELLEKEGLTINQVEVDNFLADAKTAAVFKENFEKASGMDCRVTVTHAAPKQEGDPCVCHPDTGHVVTATTIIHNEDGSHTIEHEHACDERLRHEDMSDFDSDFQFDLDRVDDIALAVSAATADIMIQVEDTVNRAVKAHQDQLIQLFEKIGFGKQARQVFNQ